MTEPREAPRELLALAVAVREDWNAEETWQAIRAAHDAGWSWKRTVDEVTRLLFMPEGQPSSMRHASAVPTKKHDPAPGTYERGGALARELLQNRPGAA